MTTKRKIPKSYNPTLMTAGNPKLMKGQKVGYFSTTLMLSPASFSGHQVCPFRSPACEKDCLNTAGAGGGWGTSQAAKARTVAVQAARIRRTLLYFENRDEFFRLLIDDIAKAVIFAAHHHFTGQYSKVGMRKHPVFKQGGSMTVAVRLNCTSDLPWERIRYHGLTIMEHFPNIQFYDYTKIPGRFRLPVNYHLTFSRSEVPESAGRSKQYFEHGVNTAVVFSTMPGHELPHSYNGIPVIDGRLTDLRFLDPKGVIVGLSALGKAADDTDSGFVVQVGKGEIIRAKKNPPDGEVDGGDLFPDLAL